MLLYIETKDESLCCGCRACEQKCHKNAITMVSNKEGFLYPEIDKELCINCGACERVCPQMNPPEKSEPLDIYAVQHNNADILSKSSSGGAFRLIADEVIAEGGCVAGCVWNDELNPIFKIADSSDELFAMQGSKYLSSNTLDIYAKVKERLVSGQLVLFTGAPCQCAGLINYLGKSYDNLLTAEFLCHGMPSQQVFDTYISHLIKKYRIKNGKRDIKNYRFRDKRKRGWGIVSSCTFVKGKRVKEKYTFESTDSYVYGFLSGYFNRYSCYGCKFRGQKRFTDFTFSDFWGVENFHPEIEKTKGVSALSINTSKADRFKNKLSSKALWTKTDAVSVSRCNASLIEDAAEPIPEIRSTIYSLIEKEGWKFVARKKLRTKRYFIKRTYYSLPKNIQKILKRVLK